MPEQYDFRFCKNCGDEVKILIKVLVWTENVPDCENVISEWSNQFWCLKCVREGPCGG